MVLNLDAGSHSYVRTTKQPRCRLQKILNSSRFTCVLLVKMCMLYQVKSEVPPGEQVHDHIYVLPVLECHNCVYKKIMF